jgi:hypothetical protein
MVVGAALGLVLDLVFDVVALVGFWSTNQSYFPVAISIMFFSWAVVNRETYDKHLRFEEMLPDLKISNPWVRRLRLCWFLLPTGPVGRYAFPSAIVFTRLRL